MFDIFDPQLNFSVAPSIQDYNIRIWFHESYFTDSFKNTIILIIPSWAQKVFQRWGIQGAKPGNERSTNNLFMKVMISKWLAKALKSD